MALKQSEIKSVSSYEHTDFSEFQENQSSVYTKDHGKQKGKAISTTYSDTGSRPDLLLWLTSG